eukprot:scaffold5502_cov48-Phaeocystis_antarctica.AAC.1
MYELGRTEGGDAGGGGKLPAKGAGPGGAAGRGAPSPGGWAGSEAAWSKCPLGSTPARLLRLLRARLVALSSLTPPWRVRLTERPATASGEDDDDDLDEMLKWSDSLDFESYHQGWLGLATSARPEWSGEAVAY